MPISAVEGHQSGSVYLPTSDPTKPEKRAVTLGITDGKMVEVKEGLTEWRGDEFTPTSNKDNQDDRPALYGMGLRHGRGPGDAAGTHESRVPAGRPARWTPPDGGGPATFCAALT